MAVAVLHEGPSAEPMLPEEVSERLGLASLDDRIEPFLRAARQSLEGVDGWLGRALMTQTWDLYLDEFPVGEVRLPFPPFRSVVEIGVTGSDGVEALLASSSYRPLKGAIGRIMPVGAWPAVGASVQGVRIRFIAGYGDAGTDVPEPIRLALVLMVGRFLSTSRADMAIRSRTVEGVGATTWMNPRDVRDGITATEDALLMPYRVWS